MNVVKLLSLNVLIFLGSAVWSEEALRQDELNPKFECLNYNEQCQAGNTKATAISTALNVALVNCQATVQSPACQEYYKSDPYLAVRARACDVKGYCKEELTSAFDTLSLCAQGYLEGTGEVFEHLTMAISKWATNVKRRVQERDKFLGLCNGSPNCKRHLVQGIPKFDAMADSVLNMYTAAALWVERDNYSYIQSTNRRNEHHSPQESAAQRGMLEDSRVESNRQSLLFAAIQWLRQKSVRLSCLDVQTRAEMICWGAAYVIDPLLVAGAAAKGIQAARYIQNLRMVGASAEKASSGAFISHSASDGADLVEEVSGAAVKETPPGQRVTPKRELRTDLRRVVSLAELRAVARDLKKSDIPFCSIGGGCDARAHKVALTLEENGIQSEKVFAVPNDEQLLFSFDRSGLMINDQHLPWRYHVANLVRVRTETGGVAEYVLDLSLFPGPVERKIWEERMRAAGGAMDFRLAEKTALRPHQAYDAPNIWDPIDLNEATKLNRSMSSNAERYQGRQALLKGRWIDRLKVGSPEKFKEFQRAMENLNFRNWWTESTEAWSYEYWAKHSPGPTFQYVERERIGELLNQVPMDRLDAEIKVRNWEDVWKNMTKRKKSENARELVH